MMLQSMEYRDKDKQDKPILSVYPLLNLF